MKSLAGVTSMALELTFILLLLVLGKAQKAHRVNCGATFAFNDTYGHEWSSDNNSTNGSIHSLWGREISIPTYPDSVYVTWKEFPKADGGSYLFDVTSKMYYMVRLHFGRLNASYVPAAFNITFGLGSVLEVGLDPVVNRGQDLANNDWVAVVEEFILFSWTDTLKVCFLPTNEAPARVMGIEVLPLNESNPLQQVDRLSTDVVLRVERRNNCGGPLVDGNTGQLFKWYNDSDAIFNSDSMPIPFSMEGVSQQRSSPYYGWVPQEVWATARSTYNSILWYQLSPWTRTAEKYLVLLHCFHGDVNVNRTSNVSFDGLPYDTFDVSFPTSRRYFHNKMPMNVTLIGSVQNAPRLNGLEVYALLPGVGVTQQSDVSALQVIWQSFQLSFEREPCLSPPAKFITCNKEYNTSRRITSLDFYMQSYKGSIPRAIGNLTGLERLNLSGNLFYGSIPDELRNLESLVVLDLSNNNLTGIIPAWLGELSRLDTVKLDNNSFTGKVPKSLKDGKKNVTYEGNPGLCDIPGEPGCQEPSQAEITDPLSEGNGSFNRTARKPDMRASSEAYDPKLLSVVLVALGVPLFILIICATAFFYYKIRKFKKEASMEGPNQVSRTGRGLELGVSVGVSAIAHAGSIGRSRSSQGFGRVDDRGGRAGARGRDVTSTKRSRTGERSVLVGLKGEKRCRSPGRDGLIGGSPTLHVFKSKELEMITKLFSTRIGAGGFGWVYKGILDNGMEVAVKVLASDSRQGMMEFKKEVEVLSQLQHKHLVKLIGYCNEGELQALVYEYVQNGTLQEHLHGLKAELNLIPWRQRLNIALDVASVINHLHNEITPPVIHRDMKSSNILLDENFQAKVGDFGFSKVLEDVTGVQTGIKGTAGYLDPEYFISRKLTEKSDIYSFGVVLLELVSGRRPVDPNQSPQLRVSIVDWVRHHLEQGNIDAVVDLRIRESGFHLESVWRVAECAMACCEPYASNRPTIKSALSYLQDAIDAEVRSSTAGSDILTPRRSPRSSTTAPE